MNVTQAASMRFVKLLRDEDFDSAVQLLSNAEKLIWDAPALRESFHGMHSYCPGPILNIEWIDVPDSDKDWFYVAVCGDDFNEAVSGIIDADGKVSELVFGRP